MTFPNIVVVDVETAGIDPNKHKLLQVGMVALNEHLEEVNRMEFYVSQPMYGVIDSAMKINNLDLGVVNRNGLIPYVANLAMKNFVECSFGVIDDKDKRPILAGHNVGFDVGFIRKQLFDDVGSNFESTFSHRVLCTHSLLLSLGLVGAIPLEVTKSHLAFEHFGIENKNAHTALSDAVATVELIKSCLHLIDPQQTISA